jgi:hypothetical protein
VARPHWISRIEWESSLARQAASARLVLACSPRSMPVLSPSTSMHTARRWRAISRGRIQRSDGPFRAGVVAIHGGCEASDRARLQILAGAAPRAGHAGQQACREVAACHPSIQTLIPRENPAAPHPWPCATQAGVPFEGLCHCCARAPCTAYRQRDRWPPTTPLPPLPVSAR